MSRRHQTDPIEDEESEEWLEEEPEEWEPEPEIESGYRRAEHAGRPRALLVSVETPNSVWDSKTSLEELANLLDASGVDAVDTLTQRLARPHPVHYVGAGKLDEIKEKAALNAIDLVVFDDELPPRVSARIEDQLNPGQQEDGLRVLDRTAVILDIFAQRARTHEGRVQVELAQYQFLLPRLRAWGGGFWSRTGGGIGTRGPGETQLEVERRRVRRRITQLEREIEHLRQHRHRVRKRRRLGGMPLVALVGYTNVGKTSLLNNLTGGTGARAADMPFVTLDPLTRVMESADGQPVLVSDTVGFISKLPAALVAAFRATLEELEDADLLLHVVDVSDPRMELCARVVTQTLHDLGLGDKPVRLVLNKADMVPLGAVLDAKETLEEAVDDGAMEPLVTSAETGEGLPALRSEIERWADSRTPWVHVLLPYQRSDLVDLFYRRGHPKKTDYGEQGTEIEGTLPATLLGVFEQYRVDEAKAG
jgi:GTP-binding protein HflX